MKTKNIIPILFLITIFLQTACDDNGISIATSVSLSEQNLKLNQGTSKTLVATANVNEITLFWTSSNPSIATVDQNGLVTAISGGTCVINCRVMNGIDMTAECKVTVVQAWVDLGLPSGTLWAACNVGAEKPEEYGDYFAWGETEPKTNYDWSTYKYCNGSSETMTKYCRQSSYGYNGFTDNMTELLPEDDAATANLGGSWRMPSYDQIVELCNSSYTTTTWTTQNGIYGRKITSKSNGNSLFLPAAGCRHGTSFDLAGSYGFYLSRSLSTRSYNAYWLRINSNFIDCSFSDRADGRSVRPVRVKVE